MTAPREILPDRIIFLSRRSTQRQFLLRPGEHTNAIIAYCLAEAAERFGIELIAWCVMSNHYHAVVYDEHARLPAFIEHLHKMIARVLNHHWGRRENLWSSEPTSLVYLPTAEAVFEKVCYVLANPVTAHLIDRIADWPGLTSLHFLDGREKQHERPKGYFRSDGKMPESAALVAKQPRCSKAVESASTWAQRVRAEVERIEKAMRATRLREGIRVGSRKSLLKVSPFDAPTNTKPHSKLRPTVACKDKQRMIAELASLMEFRRSYEEARLRYIAGDTRVVFPAGTHRFRQLGARCVPYPAVAAAA